MKQDNHEQQKQGEMGASSVERQAAFISAIAHDLKTPLTGIKLFSDLLLSHAETLDAQTQQKYLASISAETERMGRMISAIADLERSAAGVLVWREEQLDIGAIVARCVRRFEPLCRAKGLTLTYQNHGQALMTMIDAERLSRLVCGMLSNALRFTETGGIEVILASDANNVQLSVSDSGAGIDAERLDELFAPAATPALGKEIVLAFAKLFVARYRGRIWAQSSPANGASFHVELPLGQQQRGRGDGEFNEA